MLEKIVRYLCEVMAIQCFDFSIHQYFDSHDKCQLYNCNWQNNTCDSVCKEVGDSIIGYNDLKKLKPEQVCNKDKSKSV